MTALLVVSMLFLSASITGCASAQKAEESNTNEAAVETEKAAEAEIVSEVAPSPTLASEPTAEPTTEPTPEPIVYEGIDMESDLPGAEWIATFEDIIEEPKIVVFNDETNKKIIVEDGQEVVFEENDIFALYVPNGQLLNHTSGIPIDKIDFGYSSDYKIRILYLNLNQDVLHKIADKKNNFTLEFNSGESICCKVIPTFN